MRDSAVCRGRRGGDVLELRPCGAGRLGRDRTQAAVWRPRGRFSGDNGCSGLRPAIPLSPFIKWTLALVALGLGGKGWEAKWVLLSCEGWELGGGGATRRHWPGKQGHALCATAGLPHPSWLRRRVWGRPACPRCLVSDPLVPGHNQEGLRPFSLSVWNPGLCNWIWCRQCAGAEKKYEGILHPGVFPSPLPRHSSAVPLV